jgi:hypothetical protein
VEQQNVHLRGERFYWHPIDRLDIYEVVPEPASLMALGVGLAGLLGLRRRKR